jgi:hypothetical protein
MDFSHCDNQLIRQVFPEIAAWHAACKGLGKRSNDGPHGNAAYRGHAQAAIGCGFLFSGGSERKG